MTQATQPGAGEILSEDSALAGLLNNEIDLDEGVSDDYTPEAAEITDEAPDLSLIHI